VERASILACYRPYGERRGYIPEEVYRSCVYIAFRMGTQNVDRMRWLTSYIWHTREEHLILCDVEGRPLRFSAQLPSFLPLHG
jgi:hypothetical protein